MGLAKHLAALEPYLAVEQDGAVLVVRCRDEFALLELDLESKSAFAGLFETVASSAEIGALAILGTAKSFGPEVMDCFWRRVLGREEGAPAIPTPHAAMAGTDFLRGEAGVRQLAASMRQCPKTVVMGVQGEIVSPFLGACLVSDIRVAADTTVFVNRAFRFGMPPGGALTFLLPAYVGFGRASEILLEARDIPAGEALQLGLVNRVVSAEELEATALEAAQRAAALPREAAAAVKQLLTQSLLGLAAHYELETTLIRRCMHALAERGPGD